MFTGLVQGVGTVTDLQRQGADARIRIDAEAPDPARIGAGDSVCVNGVCLTALAPGPTGFSADVSGETLSCTTLGALEPGARVNLETSVTPDSLLGGHLVTGHVDGVANVIERGAEGRSVRFTLRLPGPLSRFVAAKGAICLDGVSLTVNVVEDDRFGVNIIPHTLAETTLDAWHPGSRVNVEVDLVARYVERLLETRG